jgi:hypothetical protein
MANSFKKLAELSPFIVRSCVEQDKKERAAMRVLPILENMRKNCDRSSQAGKRKSERISLAMRQLSLPMYKVAVEETQYAISASVLQDWRRNGVTVVVLAMPIQRKQLRGVSTRSIENEAIENAQRTRSNDHAMGLAQSAWRMAHLEGDKFAERVAYHWLYHGSLKPCKDKECQKCNPKRRLQALELHVGAFKYLDPDFAPRRLPSPLKSHKMPAPTLDELAQVFGEWKRHNASGNATEERRAKPLFSLRNAIVARKAH